MKNCKHAKKQNEKNCFVFNFNNKKSDREVVQKRENRLIFQIRSGDREMAQNPEKHDLWGRVDRYVLNIFVGG